MKGKQDEPEPTPEYSSYGKTGMLVERLAEVVRSPAAAAESAGWEAGLRERIEALVNDLAYLLDGPPFSLSYEKWVAGREARIAGVSEALEDSTMSLLLRTPDPVGILVQRILALRGKDRAWLDQGTEAMHRKLASEILDGWKRRLLPKWVSQKDE